jgi:hypothetical protein
MVVLSTLNAGVAAACVTATVFVSVPSVTVTVAARVTVVVFADTFTVTVPLPVALLLVSVHHVAPLLTDAVQVTLLVTFTGYEAAVTVALMLVLSTFNAGAAAVCETVTVRVSVPLVTVTVAVRVVVAVLVATFTVTVPLPVALLLVSVHHVAPLLTDATQVALLVTFTGYEAALTAASILVLSTSNVATAAVCETVTCRISAPFVTGMVAARAATVGFSATFTVTVPFLLPVAGNTVHHVAAVFTVAVHVVLLVTAME